MTPLQAPAPAAAPGGLEPIAVVGAGAVGSWFGGLLAASGRQVTLIGRAPHVQAVQQAGLQMQRGTDLQRVHLQASTALAAVQGAALVLVCVKSDDTAAVAAAIAPHLHADALVLSLQNGVQNIATLQQHLRQTVVPAVVYAATALPAPGVVQHFGGGELLIGPARPGAAALAAQMPQLQAVLELFAAAGVPVRITPEPLAALWDKLIVNCAFNAVSALTQTSYGQMAALPAVAALQRAAVQEAVAVAQADGQPVDQQTALDAVARITATMPAQRSSTAQDLARGRTTEIEHLNGFIARRGLALGVPTPVNQALYALVKLAQAVPPGAA